MSILGCELKCELCSMRRGAWAASGSRLGWVPDRSDFPSSSCLTKEPTSTIHSGVGAAGRAGGGLEAVGSREESLCPLSVKTDPGPQARNRIGNCHGQSWPAGYPGPGLVYRLGMSSLNLAMGLS